MSDASERMTADALDATYEALGRPARDGDRAETLACLDDALRHLNGAACALHTAAFNGRMPTPGPGYRAWRAASDALATVYAIQKALLLDATGGSP